MKVQTCFIVFTVDKLYPKHSHCSPKRLGYYPLTKFANGDGHTGNEVARFKRQLTATCFDGTRAVSACINNRCGGNYRCDIVRNFCCLEATITSMPLCPDNSAAVARCRNGACGSGYSCQSTGTNTNLCCRVTTTFGERSLCCSRFSSLIMCFNVFSLPKQCCY